MKQAPTEYTDVPWYLRKYIRYSTDWYHKLRDHKSAKIAEFDKDVAGGRVLHENALDLIATWKEEIAFLDQRLENGYYVDPAACNSVGVMIDWDQYTADKIAYIEDEIQQMKELHRDAPNELKSQIAEKVEVLRRKLANIQRKRQPKLTTLSLIDQVKRYQAEKESK